MSTNTIRLVASGLAAAALSLGFAPTANAGTTITTSGGSLSSGTVVTGCSVTVTATRDAAAVDGDRAVFQVNGQDVMAVPMSAGQKVTEFQWTPTHSGSHQLTIEYNYYGYPYETSVPKGVDVRSGINLGSACVAL